MICICCIVVILSFHNICCIQYASDYENWFNDKKLSKTERKDKLIAAQKSVNAQMDKIKDYKDVDYQMDVVLNERITNQFINQCLVCIIYIYIYICLNLYFSISESYLILQSI